MPQTAAQRSAAIAAANLPPAQAAQIQAGTYTGGTPNTTNPQAGTSQGITVPNTPAPAPAPVVPSTGAQPGADPTKAGTTGYDIFGNRIPSVALPASATADPSFATAQENISPTTPETEEDFYAKIQDQLQPTLDKISEAEMAAETAANVKATQATSALNFGANSRGLSGSSEATSESNDITMQRGADVAAAKQAQATALENVAQFAIPEAFSEFSAAQTRNDTNSQAYIAQQQKIMSTTLSGLSSSGLTLSDLQTSNPVEYNQLLQYAGGDPNALNALFVQAAQANIVGTPIQIGNTLVYQMKTTDANGQPTIKTINVALPSLPPTYKVTSYNQSTNGSVAYIAFPTDALGNQTIDPSKPNNGVLSGIIGGTTGTGSESTVPDPTSTAITAQTGLSINAFNFLTQGTGALSRMSQSARAQVQSEAQTWANNNGIDLSTFASQFKANNDTLASNVSRFNNTKIAEGEVTGTLSNLDSSSIDNGLSGVNIANVGKILSGQQVNDPSANEYAFYFNDLKNSLSYFYAAQQGKSSPDIIDNEDAANVIVNGLSNGGVSGLQDAVTATTQKMSTVLQNAVDGAQQNIWDLFGVGQNYATAQADSTSNSGGSATMYPAGSIVSDGTTNYVVGADGETLTPQ